MHLHICCLHKHGFTIRTLEAINNILKNALRGGIDLQAILSFTWHCMSLCMCVCAHVCNIYVDGRQKAG